MPMWMKTNFQNSNSPIMEHLEFFHDHSMIIISLVTIVTLYLLSTSMIPSISRFSNEKQEMELFWTTVPGIMLFFIALPSIKILYMTDEMQKSNFSLKTSGNQWYWSYEYPNMNNINFEAFMMKNNKLNRNLDTSTEILIPNKTPTRMVISSNDVLHSWTIPSLGVKADATPGRLNQIFLNVKRPGIMMGQCSEICGANHSFMPITLTSNSIYIEVADKSIGLLNQM